MILSKILDEGSQLLKKSNIGDPNREAKLLICHALKINEHEIISKPNKIISEKEIQIINKLLVKRAKKEPYAYIINKKYFFDMQFYVNKNVLIPRPETENIIENVLKNRDKNKALNILDLGTGSGAILLTLLNHLPYAYGVGVDISFEALRVAKKNTDKYNLSNRCSLINGNWGKSLKSNYFDVLICNPPYIDENSLHNLDNEVKKYEPIIALNGGKDGLEKFSNLLPSAYNCLKNNGNAYFEIGFDQSNKAQSLLKKNKFEIKNIIKDISGFERIIKTVKNNNI